MHTDIAIVPAAMVTLGLLAAETGAIAESWAPIAGPLSATAAVIFTVQQFLKRQEKIAEESAKTLGGIMESNTRTQDKIVDRLTTMDSSLGHVRESVAKLVDRNAAKDAA